jgi:hypothetical protein
MNGDDLIRALVAPELIVIDVTLSALLALDRALHVAHLFIDQHDDEHEIHRHVRATRRASESLRAALGAYRVAVDDIIEATRHHRDLPF